MTAQKIGVAVLVAAVTAATWAGPQAVTPRFPTSDLVIAEEIVTPPAATDTDAAPFLQAAIDRTAQRGGGTVFAAAGTYRIASRIIVREGVTLRGDFSAQAPGAGTLLSITADKGREDAPATFSIERGGGLVGLTFWYPEQRLPDPVPYPWTIKNATMPANDNQTVADCTFVNAWKAICIGPDGNELHTFRNLKICALKTGIEIDSTTDIGRISKVTVAPAVWLESGLPGVPSASALRDHLLREDTVGVMIGRSDWEYIWRLEVFGYRRGLVFRKGARGTTNAVMAESRLTGCGRACEVQALNQVGLSAYCCEFAGTEHAWFGTPSFDAVVQFHSCRFDGVTANDGSGVVTFHACDLATADVTCVPDGQLTAMDCALGRATLAARRVRLLGFDAAKARVDGLDAAGDVMVHAAACGKAGEPVVWGDPPPFPRPKSDALFVVTAFGASPEREDNAAAFQAALDKAGANPGGGTVYVPGGRYAFRGDIVVPTGVELRGCSDVPHHTVSGGTVLLVHHNRGAESGSPFVSLAGGSGLRGVTFWYPEQPLKAPEPYPWTVRALGKHCWLKDVTIGNAWQAVDLATHRSDGHRVSYLAGAMFRRGLFVGGCKATGWIEDVQFNPHYACRLPKDLPRVEGERPGDVGGRVIQFQREHLEGIVIRDCRDARLRGTFLYAAYDGLAFRGDCRAQVLMHGTDTGSRAVVFEMTRGARVDMALTQLVSLGDWAQAAIVTLPADRGTARLLNSQMWAGPATAILEGSGTVRLEQFNTLTGPIEARAGRLEVLNGVFDRVLSPHLSFSAPARGEVVGTLFERGPLRVEADRRHVRTFANSLSSVPPALDPGDVPTQLASGFEPGEPAAVVDTVATRGGGLRRVSDNRCGAVERADAHSGRYAVRLAGVSDDPAYSFVYQTLFKQPVFVMPDTVLTYWFKPLNESGRGTGIDLLFADGKTLRQSGSVDRDGISTFPGVKRGRLDAWTQITVPLGKFAGNTIVTVMAAYDTRKGGGRFESLFDDLRIAPELSPAAWRVRLEPAGGRVARGTQIRLVKEPSVRVRYTLDGSAPKADSPEYKEPFTLTQRGVVEVQVTPLTLDGALSEQVFGALYEVE
ncbi:MAG: glycosyl hydrolase family 28-related protein [Kiritimatiellae bacterium]|jgi:hypothetical protein|nr:glycosyl hydrolase family 28-related protein [Kiritimatiellia bacterium]MDD3585018.1 glycosyl hydrolase family 28-related protein [Kiritimatiellia bacterium]HHU15243.1 hypothetical protein [Lentisphaerota bacterium]HON47196.1 glycosyl hydrolase family 28-related protein [Kiritimatiellia bacterium]